MKIAELIGLDPTEEKYLKDVSDEEFFGYPARPLIEAENILLAKTQSIAYFSMEYGLAPSIYHTFKTVNPIMKSNILAEHEVFSNMKDIDRKSTRLNSSHSSI